MLLFRHGQAEHNVSGQDVPDAPLTAKGRAQAVAWRGHISRFGAEVVFISPLQRAVETACLALEGTGVPLELCRVARELWWHERANQPGTLEDLQQLLQGLPRGEQVQGVIEANAPCKEVWHLKEEASIERLQVMLAMRPEEVVLVVCHAGVIKELCGADADNGEIIECIFDGSGKLKVVAEHLPPGAHLRMCMEDVNECKCC